MNSCGMCNGTGQFCKLVRRALFLPFAALGVFAVHSGHVALGIGCLAVAAICGFLIMKED